MASQGRGQGTRKGDRKQTGQKEGEVGEGKQRAERRGGGGGGEMCENESSKDKLRSLHR